MADPLDLIESLDALDIPGIAVKVLEEKRDTMAQLNVNQMMAGKNTLNEEIGEYANELYAEVKNRMNPLPGFGVPDLKVTGDFHRGLYAEIKGDEIEYGSKDSKEGKLQGQYGSEIFGLSEDSKEQLVESELQPAWQSEIESQTGLKFG